MEEEDRALLSLQDGYRLFQTGLYVQAFPSFG
jgi:hypothetical protein